jgi:hypothetical protein
LYPGPLAENFACPYSTTTRNALYSHPHNSRNNNNKKESQLTKFTYPVFDSMLHANPLCLLLSSNSPVVVGEKYWADGRWIEPVQGCIQEWIPVLVMLNLWVISPVWLKLTE